MFAVLIALATTALVALVLLPTIAIVQRRRVPRSPSIVRHPPLRHTARGVSAALLLLALSSAGLAVSFGSAQADAAEPRHPSAIVPPSPLITTPPPVGQLETLPLETLPLD